MPVRTYRDVYMGWRPDEPNEAIAHQSWANVQNIRFTSKAAKRILSSGQFGTQSLTYSALAAAAPDASVSTADAIVALVNHTTNADVQSMLCFTTTEIYQSQSDTLLPWDTDQGDRLGVHYTAGQADCSWGTTVTGSASADWTTGTDTTDRPRAGDWMSFAHDSYVAWHQIRSITNDTTLELVANGPDTTTLVNYKIRILHTQNKYVAWHTQAFHDSVAGAGNAMMVATNGVDHPIKWAGSGQFEFLGGVTQLENGTGASSPTIDPGLKFRCMASWHNLLFVGNTNEDGNPYPYRLRWSNLANCDTNGWHQADGFGTDYANYIDIIDGEHTAKLVAIEPMGDGTLIVYGQKSIHRCSWVGLALGTIERHPISFAVGAISHKAIASNGAVHCFCDSENIYLLSAGRPTPIPMGKSMQKYWKDRFNKNGGDNISIIWRADTSEFWIAFTGNPGSTPTVDEVIILALPDGDWQPIHSDTIEGVTFSRAAMTNCTAMGRLGNEHDLTWDEFFDFYDGADVTWEDAFTADDTWDKMRVDTDGLYLWGDSNGRTYYFERDTGEGSNPLERTGELITKLHSFGAEGFIKRIQKVAPLTDSNKLFVGFRIGLSDSPTSDDITWYGRDGTTSGANFTWKDGARLAGAYIAVKFILNKDSSDNNVEIHGYMIEYVVLSRQRWVN